MRQATLTVIAIAALMLAACGSGTSTTSSTTGGNAAATITLGSGAFVGNTTITIKAGQAIKFDDSSGGSHNLVTGTNGTFAQEAGAPSDFPSGGLPFNGGDVKTITFPTAGTYKITCTFHPSMQANITVTN